MPENLPGPIQTVYKNPSFNHILIVAVLISYITLYPKRLDAAFASIYNVITMRTTIIAIGNSKGIRIPKVLLKESGIDNEVEIKATKSGIKITPLKTIPKKDSETAALSETILRKDWDRPEEDKAWANL
ncbi:transcriptional regulator/antitoxin, MazE [candidate division TM7 genomosp. GTL1]|nr:transcriptional regulator/antitoxin, MazE [candidate division TM7 genomosp. GTL1]